MKLQPNPKAVEAEVDDIELESGGIRGGLTHGAKDLKFLSLANLGLAFQSIGIIYGDVGTSPLYVFSSIFPINESGSGIDPTEKHLLGALSLVIWTLTLIALLKYVLIVLSADDNGEGGTFALYSLLCRHARVGVGQNEQATDRRLSTYSMAHGGRPLAGVGARIKEVLEDYAWLQHALLVVVMLGTSMAIGDGVFTPAISVLSAVSGLRVKADNLSQNWVVAIACIVVVFLFALQQRGTSTVGFLFAPIVAIWYIAIAAIGIYNVINHNVLVFKAFSPHYGIDYLVTNGREGWISLGGVLLCITGIEAMFADLGHFNQASIQISFCGIVYPSLLLQYLGQAAYLSKHPEHVQYAFYKSVPTPLFWPMLIVATAAAIVASQAMISGTFSLIRQAMFLGCFPPVKVVHTSSWVVGQVYIPEANWALMLLTLAVTIGFRSTGTLGNAYGFAVLSVLLITTVLTSIIMLVVWRRRFWEALAFLLFFGTIEAVFLSSVVFKVPQGAWVPLALATIIMIIMYTWHYGTSKKIAYDRQNKVSMNWLLSLSPNANMARVPGFGLFYTELTSGVPPIFSHFVANLPALHQVLVFVCIKHVPVPIVPDEETFLIRRVGNREYRMYRCVVRLGYMQEQEVSDRNSEFEERLFSAIVEFAKSDIRRNGRASLETPEDSWPANMPLNRPPLPKAITGSGSEGGKEETHVKEKSSSRTNLLEGLNNNNKSEDVFASAERRQNGIELVEDPSANFSIASSDEPVGSSEGMGSEEESAMKEELEVLTTAKESGMVYIVSQAYVQARKSSWWGKKFVVNVLYSFLKRNFREATTALGIPHNSLMEVGMVYVI